MNTAPQSPRPTLIPTLSAVQLSPEFERPVAHAYTFLKTIERVEIKRVEAIDSELFFVVEIYCHSGLSQIPTVLQRKHNAVVQQSLWDIHEYPMTKVAARPREPDVILKRSLTAFQDLRKAICHHLELENRGNCHTCNAWMTYTTFAMNRAKLTMRVVPLMAVKKRELAKFLNAAVLLSIQATIPPSRRQSCPVGEAITLATNGFLQHSRATF